MVRDILALLHATTPPPHPATIHHLPSNIDFAIFTPRNLLTDSKARIWNGAVYMKDLNIFYFF